MIEITSVKSVFQQSESGNVWSQFSPANPKFRLRGITPGWESLITDTVMLVYILGFLVTFRYRFQRKAGNVYYRRLWSLFTACRVGAEEFEERRNGKRRRKSGRQTSRIRWPSVNESAVISVCHCLNHSSSRRINIFQTASRQFLALQSVKEMLTFCRNNNWARG